MIFDESLIRPESLQLPATSHRPRIRNNVPIAKILLVRPQGNEDFPLQHEESALPDQVASDQCAPAPDPMPATRGLALLRRLAVCAE
jgi:hypothetical protein